MSYSDTYLSVAPSRETVDRFRGAVVLEFGTPWCGHCARARPLVESVLQQREEVAHLKIEDGPGRKLGRSFGVKLWPTLVFLKDGAERARLVRPLEKAPILDALAQIAAQSSSATMPGNNTSV